MQAERLEQAMIVGRRWAPEEFTTFLAHHPLMTHLARRLLWAGYDGKGKLVRLLRLADDGTVVDADGQPSTLDGLTGMGIVHPLHLSSEQREAWARVFAEFEILPPFPQLHRPVHTLPPEEQQGTTFRRPTGTIPAATLRSRCEGRGWRRVLHAHGGIEGFNKPFQAAGITAVILIRPGMLLGYGENDDQTVDRVFFVQGIDEPYNFPISDPYEDRKRYLALKGIDPVALSEVLLDLTELER